ncbi:ASHH1 [Scenedesmus sp. PABB004]|nr:ASHH1 [Scenedesmus sp. PABB004]
MRAKARPAPCRAPPRAGGPPADGAVEQQGPASGGWRVEVLWAPDARGALQPVALAGDSFVVASDDEGNNGDLRAAGGTGGGTCANCSCLLAPRGRSWRAPRGPGTRQQLCGACALYETLAGRPRPVADAARAANRAAATQEQQERQQQQRERQQRDGGRRPASGGQRPRDERSPAPRPAAKQGPARARARSGSASNASGGAATAGLGGGGGGGALPPGFKVLRRNTFPLRARRQADDDEPALCGCRPELGQRCRDEDGCLNRLSKVCCTPGACPAGDACANAAFAARKAPALRVVRVGGKGWGVVAGEAIRAGELVAEYIGEVVPVAEAARRLEEYAAAGAAHTYVMDLSRDEAIDATAAGGVARFINHSCAPNAETQKWQVGGEQCVGIFAARPIAAGEEVTYDYCYRASAVPHARTRCACGAPSCRGWLGDVDARAHLQAELEEQERRLEAAVVREVDARGEVVHVDGHLDLMLSDDD